MSLENQWLEDVFPMIPGFFLAFDGVSLEIEILVFFGKNTQTPFWDVLHTQLPVGAVVVSRDPKEPVNAICIIFGGSTGRP